VQTKRSTRFSIIEIPDVMIAMPRAGIVLPLDLGSNLNNAQSHNPESASKSLELKISAFAVAEIIILRKSASSVVPVRGLDTLGKSAFDHYGM
jgi:hypothetical protein